MPAPDLPPPPDFEFAPRERPLSVHLHMNFVAPDVLAGGVVIVIDAIRASATIAKALEQGAARVIPVLTAQDARDVAMTLRARAPGSRVLLGGERGGRLIEGFDLDNSPRSYVRERIDGATIVFTTSNGTAGLLHARQAARVLVGSMVNARAVAREVLHDPRPVHILCCGTRSEVSLDDCLPAGAMVELLLAQGRNATADDGVLMCLHAWRGVISQGTAHNGQSDALRHAFAASRGGRNLVRMGLAEDVAFCATPDLVPIVPEFRMGASDPFGEIRVA